MHPLVVADLTEHIGEELNVPVGEIDASVSISGILLVLEFRSLDQCGACELWGVCDVIGVSP